MVKTQSLIVKIRNSGPYITRLKLGLLENFRYKKASIHSSVISIRKMVPKSPTITKLVFPVTNMLKILREKHQESLLCKSKFKFQRLDMLSMHRACFLT
jgi:hypothetical protein